MVESQAAIALQAQHLRESKEVIARWAGGFGVVAHDALTQVRVGAMARQLVAKGLQPDVDTVYEMLMAADRLSNAACWLVVHMTFAKHVRLDGRALLAEDFKLDPQGHTGGSLNVVPAYVGYLTLNALTHVTRAWMMGQGHCVSAIDAANVLVGNTTAAHAAYELSDLGLTRLVKDFYRYRVRPDGKPESPLGSHVNANTAGGMLEGGYLGFADLQYVHSPLPGERLVAFLSDGAFEEQRGADWAARWWRDADSGVVVPVMIANGRRIDQRSTIMQAGGSAWLAEHLILNGFEPLIIDGRDPAAFMWAMFAAEHRLLERGEASTSLVRLPYVVAEAPKGYGFPNAGTNLAHGTPLSKHPAHDEATRIEFNEAMRRLWQPLSELTEAISRLCNHEVSGRVRERDHALVHRDPLAIHFPALGEIAESTEISPMVAVDSWMERLFCMNPLLRPRVGNPDELRSNRMDRVLDLLQHRVAAPEPGNSESINGAVITALNEEAVASACFANKAGLNLIVSYEAFAVKMLGAIRQEIIFARHQKEAGRPAQWHSVPIIVTSHTWENGKNEQSHQDPTLVEALSSEMSDMVRVLYPACANSAVAALANVYERRGQIAALVIPKQALPRQLAREQAIQMASDGALVLLNEPGARIELVAVGAYQLVELQKAATRLRAHGVPLRLVYLMEPARMRWPRDEEESRICLLPARRDVLFDPATQLRLFLVHGHPEPFLGLVRPLDLGGQKTCAMGYSNRGGTLDVGGMLYANRCTFGHVLYQIAESMGVKPALWLSEEELAAVEGRGSPYALISEPHRVG